MEQREGGRGGAEGLGEERWNVGMGTGHVEFL